MTTHRHCITAYSPYWGRMYCFNHNRPFKSTTTNPTHKPAGVFGRLRATLTGKKS